MYSEFKLRGGVTGMEITEDVKEIAEQVSSLSKNERTMVKVFIAGMEAKDKAREDQKAAG